MSSWEPSFDAPLLSSPWHPLPFPSRLILKYAPHPSRPGYVLLLTDLTSVYCEVLTGPGVLSRMTEVDRTLSANARKKGKGRTVDQDDLIGRSEAALKSVEEMWGSLGGAQVEMKEHDYHDAVLSVQTEDFGWLFYLTELKGRQPLEILSKHLIAPLAGILLETNNIKTDGNKDPMDLVHTLFQQSPTITQHMAAHHASAPSSSSRAKRPTPHPAKPSEKTGKSPAKAKASSPAREPKEEEEEEEYVSEEEVPQTRNTPKKPAPKPQSASTEAKAPPSKKAPAKAKARHIIESETEAEADPLPEEEEQAPAAAEDASEGESAEKSLTPPPPTMSSQASKKERERLEEEEMKSRAEAMKRKMEGGGAGGGNLGRRRLRR